MKESILIQYLSWHFISCFKGLLNVWRSFLLFNLNYWSLPLLLRTLFSPWRRYQYSYGKGFDIKRFFEVLTFNSISRTMGFIMRTFLIVFGILTELALLLGGVLALLCWLVLPGLILLSFYHGCRILF
jgi:hypothetical protein